MSTTPQPPRGRTFDSPEQEVYLNLWRTYDRLRKLEDDLFDEHDLSAQQYNALRLLKAHPEGMQTMELASRLISRTPDITRLLNRLETRKLVARNHPEGNRRVLRVTITQEGLDLLKKLAGPIEECARKQLGHLSDEQKAQLVALLHTARRPHEPTDSGW